MIGGGGVRPVSAVSGPAGSAWLRRRKEGLEAQHRALEEDRIDDLVRLMRHDDDAPEQEAHEDGDGPDEESRLDPEASAALAREVNVLATEMEERLARVRADALAELQDLERRIELAGFRRSRSVARGGKRGSTLNAYV